jgi:hypothetical protein
MVKKRGLPKYINFDDKDYDDFDELDDEDKPKIAA